jgi:spore coat polysaccharide biosynthesis protein SpsF (cytidylyltransferase family)
VSARTAIVLQARMGSRRLPGKTLATIAGRTVLEHCVERLSASTLPVVLATTTREQDDPLEQEARRLGIDVVRGPDEDVLGRFVMVANTMSLDEIVRATADNPAVDIDSARRTLEIRRRTGADHVVEEGLPYGATVEAFSADALFRAARLTSDPHDREHVTPFMQRDPRFVARRAAAPAAVRRPELRLTVDTPADLVFVQRVFEHAERLNPRPVPLSALIAAAATVQAGVCGA